MDYRRSNRVADLLQQEIADLVFRRVKDPRVSGVTISGVEVTADLQHARVFFCVMGNPSEEQKKTVSEGLAKACGFLHQELVKRLHMKHVPRIEFHYDQSFEYGDKIDRLLKEIQRDE